MEIIIAKDNEQTKDIACKKISKLIKQKESTALELATGSTPVAIYQIVNY